jgi:hypothetical protein
MNLRARVLMLAATLAAVPASAWAQDPSAGHFTLAGDRVAYSRALGMFDPVGKSRATRKRVT